MYIYIQRDWERFGSYQSRRLNMKDLDSSPHWQQQWHHTCWSHLAQRWTVEGPSFADHPWTDLTATFDICTFEIIWMVLQFYSSGSSSRTRASMVGLQRLRKNLRTTHRRDQTQRSAVMCNSKFKHIQIPLDVNLTSLTSSNLLHPKCNMEVWHSRCHLDTFVLLKFTRQQNSHYEESPSIRKIDIRSDNASDNHSTCNDR